LGFRVEVWGPCVKVEMLGFRVSSEGSEQKVRVHGAELAFRSTAVVKFRHTQDSKG